MSSMKVMWEGRVVDWPAEYGRRPVHRDCAIEISRLVPVVGDRYLVFHTLDSDMPKIVRGISRASRER